VSSRSSHGLVEVAPGDGEARAVAFVERRRDFGLLAAERRQRAGREWVTDVGEVGEGAVQNMRALRGGQGAQRACVGGCHPYPGTNDARQTEDQRPDRQQARAAIVPVRLGPVVVAKAAIPITVACWFGWAGATPRGAQGILATRGHFPQIDDSRSGVAARGPQCDGGWRVQRRNLICEARAITKGVSGRPCGPATLQSAGSGSYQPCEARPPRSSATLQARALIAAWLL
jgi:hypothetical protein